MSGFNAVLCLVACCVVGGFADELELRGDEDGGFFFDGLGR